MSIGTLDSPGRDGCRSRIRLQPRLANPVPPASPRMVPATPASDARATQKPPGADPNPDAIQACKPGVAGFRFGTSGDDLLLKDYGPNEIICALGGNDRIEVRYVGTKVWAGLGHDTIVTRQRAPSPNEIRAGKGKDTAHVDRLDSWKEVESIRSASSTESPGAATLTYPSYQPRVSCRIVDGERRLSFEPPPQMRAADRTARVDWQSVAWSPVLVHYNPATASWEAVVQNEWLWIGRTTSSLRLSRATSGVALPPSKSSGPFWFTAFRPQEFYKVAVYYYHYAEGGIPAHRIYTYVDEYVGDQGVSDGKSCWFRQ